MGTTCDDVTSYLSSVMPLIRKNLPAITPYPRPSLPSFFLVTLYLLSSSGMRIVRQAHWWPFRVAAADCATRRRFDASLCPHETVSRFLADFLGCTSLAGASLAPNVGAWFGGGATSSAGRRQKCDGQGNQDCFHFRTKGTIGLVSEFGRPHDRG